MKLKKEILLVYCIIMITSIIFVHFGAQKIFRLDTFDSRVYYQLYQDIVSGNQSNRFFNIKSYEIGYNLFLKSISSLNLNYEGFVSLNLILIVLWKVIILLLVVKKNKTRSKTVLIVGALLSYPLYSQDIWVWRNVFANLAVVSFLIFDKKILKVFMLLVSIVMHYSVVPFFIFYFIFRYLKLDKVPIKINFIIFILASLLIAPLLLRFSSLFSQGNLVSYINKDLGGSQFNYVVLCLLLISLILFQADFLRRLDALQKACFGYVLSVALVVVPFWEFGMILFRANNLSYYLIMFVILSQIDRLRYKTLYGFGIYICSFITIQRMLI